MIDPDLDDAVGFRIDFTQSADQAGQQSTIRNNFFWRRIIVENVIRQSSLAIRQRFIEGSLCFDAKSAVETVAIAEPPFVSRAEAMPSILHSLSKIRAPAFVLLELIR